MAKINTNNSYYRPFGDDSNSFGAEYPFEEPGGSDFDVGFESAPEFVDLDGDGDFDLVSGTSNGQFQYYENIGTASSPNFVERTGGSNPFDSIDAGFDSEATFLDYDNDGDLDLIVGNSAGKALVYENTSGTYSSSSSELIGGFDAGSRTTWTSGDINGDGFLDLVSGTDSGEWVYLENDGDGTFTERTGASNPFNSAPTAPEGAPQLIDWDEDGDLDVVYGRQDGDINLLENDGSGNYSLVSTANNPFSSINTGNESSPQLVDINDDGNLDLVIGNNDGKFHYYTTTCFTTDCEILTVDGLKKAADITTSDWVVTVDNGPQKIHWVGRSYADGTIIRENPGMAPVRFMPGSLGAGLPRREMLVSQQHRMLISSKIAKNMFDSKEVLVAAKSLVSLPGIDIVSDIETVTYIHFLCSRHELIYSNGSVTETLFAGPQAMKMIPARSVAEIYSMFPYLKHLHQEGRGPVSAREILSVKRGRNLAKRMLSKGRVPLECLVAA